MRITNGMMMRKYGRNLNINLGRMNYSSSQIESGKRFMRASEDPVRALKALQVRRNLSSLEQYKSNIETVDTWLANTETAVNAVKSHADAAVDLLIQGRNDPSMAPEDRLIIATSLRNIQEALLKDLNSQSAGKYVLGGANTKEVPFRVHKGVDDNPPDALKLGHLMFNNQDVYEMGMTDAPPSGADFTAYNSSVHLFDSMQSTVYVDLTGEFQLKDTVNPADGIDDELVDKSTVFDMYTAGISIIGVGPNNLYNLIGRIATAFESEFNTGIDKMTDIDGPIDPLVDPDFGGDSGLFKRLQDAQLNSLVALTNVGAKTNFVTFLYDRNDEYIYQAEVMRNKLEVMPPDEAIMNFKMQDYIYKACLQMGSYVFQPSLMDYIKG